MFKYFWLVIPFAVYIMMIGMIFYVLTKQENKTVRVDCTWIEIQPDIPTKIREECRKKLSGRI